MRYDEHDRMDGISGAWLRFKLRMSGYPWIRPVILSDLDSLTDHLRRDIGAPEPTRYMDWKALRDIGRT